MLFMGSKKYPGEDEMEAFLSKHGGSSNAFTDCTHTCYYFEVKKSALHQAVDLLAQFFPIEAIESEFRLTQNNDDSRLEGLLSHFARWPFKCFGDLSGFATNSACCLVACGGEVKIEELTQQVSTMKAQLEKQDAEMGRQGMAIELQAVEIKQLKAQCETALSMAQEAAPAVEWGCLTQQQKFMVQFLFVLVFSIIAVPLPLLIPINDPNAGALGNMSFFYGYNIFVIVYYLPGQYRRLELLLVRPPNGKEMARSSSAISYLGKVTWQDTAKRVIFYLLVIFGWCTGYFLCAVPWGTNLIYSYNMLYGAPPTFAMVDWLFLVLADRSYWNVKTLILIFVYNFLTLAPVLLLCGIVFASAFFNTPVLILCAALASWILMEVVGIISDKVLQILIPWAGYSLEHYYQVGNSLVFSCLLTFSEVILFPSTNSWWALVGVVIVDTIGAALQLRVLWKCVVSDRRRLVFVVLGVKLSSWCSSLVGLLSGLLFSFLRCFLAARSKGEGISQETREALWSQCEVDVARFWPVLVALPPLVWLMDDRNPNRQYYYLFDCTTAEHMNITVVCILVKLGWTCALTTVDVVLCTSWGIGLERAKQLTKMYDKHWVMMTATFALSGALFTSCWLVKHDGLRLLEAEPRKQQVDIHQELRSFFQEHYQAAQLRVCLFGVESLESLESESCCFSFFLEESDYRSQPLNYLGHLVGHEGAGSLQSFLKQQGLATEVEAGVSEEDFTSNWMCSLFSVDITLTDVGLTAWMEVAQITFLYLAMLRREGPQEWIYEELRRAQDRRTYRRGEMSWRFLEETDPMEYVQKLACQMLPDLKREPEHILKAEWMLNSWEPGKITEFLELLRMERAFVILVAAFGKDEAEEGEDSSGPNGSQEAHLIVAVALRGEGGKKPFEALGLNSRTRWACGGVGTVVPQEEPAAHDPPVEPGGAGDSAPIPAPAESERAVGDPHFDLEAAGPPSREPHFGTEFWKASDAEVQRLVACCQQVELGAGLAAEAVRYLRLPDRNPFFATDFELRTAPQNSSFSCLEEWLSAGGQGTSASALQRLRAALSTCALSSLAAGPPRAPPARPQRVSPGHWAWHLQDTVLCTPRSELWLKFSVAEGLAEAKEQALLAWLVRVLSDVLNETVYLAEQASLELRVQEEPYGLDLRAGGFHQKLPQLLTEGCKALRSAGDPHSREWWQGESFVRRCWNQRDDLLRHWRNEYLKPEDHCADLRRALVMPEKLLSTAKAAALQDLGLEELQRFAEAFIPQLQLEVLYQGNVTREEALTLVDELSDLMGTGPTDEGPHALHPPTRVLEVPLEGSPIVWFQDSPDAKDRNVAMEMYWQLGRSDGAEARETAKVELLQDVLAEPFFDQLRTKQQVGYLRCPLDAPCARLFCVACVLEVWPCGDLPKDITEEFQGHVEAMAAAKLEPERSLKSLQQSAWAELQERSHCFDRTGRALEGHLGPATSKANETKECSQQGSSSCIDLLRDLTSPRRRLLITAAIGGKAVERSAALAQEAFAQRYPAARWVSSPSELFASSKFFT
eukprot:g28637.t3